MAKSPTSRILYVGQNTNRSTFFNVLYGQTSTVIMPPYGGWEPKSFSNGMIPRISITFIMTPAWVNTRTSPLPEFFMSSRNDATRRFWSRNDSPPVGVTFSQSSNHSCNLGSFMSSYRCISHSPKFISNSLSSGMASS